MFLSLAESEKHICVRSYMQGKDLSLLFLVSKKSRVLVCIGMTSYQFKLQLRLSFSRLQSCFSHPLSCLRTGLISQLGDYRQLSFCAQRTMPETESEAARRPIYVRSSSVRGDNVWCSASAVWCCLFCRLARSRGQLF